MKRRNFITQTAAVAVLPFMPRIEMKKYKDPEELLNEYLPVNFTRDGLNLYPELYTKILELLIEKKDFAPDSYGLGGMIHAFEEKVARTLGKEKAVYMPTGTLANHIALRKHCNTQKRAIVQYDSHINRDSGDCVTSLSGINLITLGGNKIIYDLNELETFLEDNKHGKVKTPVGAISLETPVRRKNLQRIPFERMEKICAVARKNGIALHLDGARLFIDAAFSGKNIKDYTRLFDTVYVSLYKSFNSVNGAILAGPENIIEGLHNERRMFGGGLPSSWQQIAIADYFFDHYEKRYAQAKEQFESFTKLIHRKSKFNISPLENGSSVFKLTIPKKNNPEKLRSSLGKQQIYLPKWNTKDQCFYIKMNDSLVYNDMKKTVKAFINS
jgi:threonine aldolase